MDTDRVASWLQILASTGILVGLILVGIQINQSSQITALDLKARTYEMNSLQQVSMMGENPSVAWEKAFTEPERLSADELMVIYSYLDFRYDALDFHTTMQEMTVLDEWWKGPLRYHAENTFGANEVTRTWWSIKTHHSTWARYIDEILENETTTPEYESFISRFCKTKPNSDTCKPADK